MKLAFIYGPKFLTFRGSLDFENIWDDPRGLTGSEVGVIRTAEECAEAGHDVTLFTVSKDRQFGKLKIAPFEERLGGKFDAVVSWNNPDDLRGASGFRVCEQMLNDFSYCEPGFGDHVNLYTSPSRLHRERIAPMVGEKPVEVIPLGCDHFVDPEQVGKPGSVVYTSSPDRGLHLLLQEWPAIKKAVPHATLDIFYRLRSWVQDLKGAREWPPIEKLRTRALYIEEALRRMECLDVCARDSVSRRVVRLALADAEVFAYPCDPIAWTEGFSCSTLEACAAQACPVVMGADALPDIYGHAVSLVSQGNATEFRERVIRALTDEGFRKDQNTRALNFALEHTWTKRTAKLLSEIERRI